MKIPTSRRAATTPWKRAATIALLAVVLNAASYESAAAHDQGTLRLVSRMFRAGDSLAIVGTKFTKNDEVSLLLVGVTGRVKLVDVPTDTAGAFRRVVRVPPSVAVGQYRLVAEAIDGDEVAALEVMVHAGPSAAPMAPPAAMPGTEGVPGHEGMDPTGEALSIDRARGTAVTATAILLITACVGAGAMLLRRPQAIPLEEQP